MLLLSTRRRSLAVAAVAMPHLFYPQGLRSAIASRSVSSIVDAYVQLAQETCEDIGFLEGLWRFRHLVPESSGEVVRANARQEGTGLVQ
jgi:hypothetical protein